MVDHIIFKGKRLFLKENDICLVMRNLNKKEGLTTNTRVKILKIFPYVIRVCTLNPDNRKYFNIPRIKFTVTLPFGRSIAMQRVQFPLRLAYAMTYNKSQGQEFAFVVCDIRKEPFTHGHLYVALSRIRIAANIRIFSDSKQANSLQDDDLMYSGAIVTNVVYNKLKLQ